MISLCKRCRFERRILRVILFSILILAFYFPASAFSAETGLVCFKTICIHAEIAQTGTQKKQGLMGRKQLLEGHGMLFTYDHEVQPDFWMKNMLIPLDFVWLNRQGEVVNISERIPPCGANNCPIITSPKRVQYVLELPSGSIQKIKIKSGDHAVIQLGEIS